MPAKPEQVRTALENYVKAWATNDKPLFLSLFATDAQWWDPVGTPPFKRTLEPKVHEIRACANEGILRFTMQVRIPSRRQALDLSVIDYVVLNDAGKIQTARAFWDETSASTPEGWGPFAPNVAEAYET